MTTYASEGDFEHIYLAGKRVDGRYFRVCFGRNRLIHRRNLGWNFEVGHGVLPVAGRMKADLLKNAPGEGIKAQWAVTMVFRDAVAGIGECPTRKNVYLGAVAGGRSLPSTANQADQGDLDNSPCPNDIQCRRVIFTGFCGQCGWQIFFHYPKSSHSRAQCRFHAGDQPFTAQEFRFSSSKSCIYEAARRRIQTVCAGRRECLALLQEVSNEVSSLRHPK